jgi:hypothetical protein
VELGSHKPDQPVAGNSLHRVELCDRVINDDACLFRKKDRRSSAITIFEAKLLDSVPLIPHSLCVNTQEGSDLRE